MAGRHERALAALRGTGAAAIVAARPSTVAWLTGFAGDVETGPSPFSLPPLALVAPGETPILVVADDAAEAAAATGCDVRPYRGFSLGPVDAVAGATRALVDAVAGRRVAVEADALPAALAHELSWVDLAGALRLAQAVKDDDEVDLIRAAIALCDAGQRELRRRAAPGIPELELWAHVRGAIEREAGARTPVLADLVAGPRTGETGGAPDARELRDGDLVLCDLVPRRDGYWGDCCATVAVGESTPTAREKHRVARERLERLLDATRPGAVAGELDALARDGLEYWHHSGHGLGADWHEEPRIVPGSPIVLEAGMVVAYEPGVYAEGEGVRVEQVVLVTHDGCEILSGHDLEL
jgi:Xaa-Pro dipeptidase